MAKSKPIDIRDITKSDPLGVDKATAEWLGKIVRLTSYSSCLAIAPDGRPTMSLERFLQVRALVIYDVFTTLSNKAKQERVGWAAGTQQKCRRHQDYKQVKERVVEVVDQLNATDMMEAAKSLEPVMVEETTTHALLGKGSRDRQKAVEEFTGRLSAKKTRDDSTGRGMQLPPEFLELIRATLELQQEKRAALPAEYEVLGSEINTPEEPREEGN